MTIFDRLSMRGQVALITGGGAGIGRGIALAFASLGADIVIAEREPERCTEVQSAIEVLGRKVIAVEADVSDPSALDRVFVALDKSFGRLDVLVNNAGGVAPKKFIDQSAASWQRLIDLNLMSVFSATSMAVERMIAARSGGSVLNIASIEGTRAAPDYAVYAACKAAVLNFTRTMAVELADHNIRVNAIAPDYIDTPGLRGNIRGPVDPAMWHEPTDAQADATRRRIPLGRPGSIEECADAAVYLASDLASYITGITLPVDGGTSGSGGWVRTQSGRWSLVGDI